MHALAWIISTIHFTIAIKHWSSMSQLGLLWTSTSACGRAWSAIRHTPRTAIARRCAERNPQIRSATRQMCYFDVPFRSDIEVVRPCTDDPSYFDEPVVNVDNEREPSTAVSKAILKYHHFRPFSKGTLTNQPLFVGGEDAGTLLDPNIEVLLKHSQPAAFGKGSETVFDEAVRLARSIPADLIKRDKDGKDLELDDKRKVAWLSSHGKVDVKLSKLHVYEKGGHFKPHRDTLCDQNHVGSIVVLLGSAFLGGRFMLHGKSCPLKVDRARQLLPFVAFYTDTVHEIQPVKLGVRASLQFDVYAGYPDYNYEPFPIPGISSPHLDNFFEEGPDVIPRPFVNETLCDDLVAAVVRQIGEEDCNALVIPTYHRYTNFALKASSLKPIDGLVLRKLVERGYSVVPVSLDLYSEYLPGNGENLLTKVDTFGGAQVPEGAVFVMPPTLEGAKLGEQEYIEFTGNHAVAEAHAYRLGGLLIRGGS